MKKLIKPGFILAIICCSTTTDSTAQVQAGELTVLSSGLRSKAANRFYEEDFRTVGVYKVKGSPYVLKGNNVSDLYSTVGNAVNVPVVFDTYKQEVGVMQDDKKTLIPLTMEEVDSFYLKVDNDKQLTGPMMFRNMSKIDPSEKSYMQEVVKGKKYSLYKSYYADMKSAASDVAQNNMKEFEIRNDFYFVDNTKDGNKKLVKIRPNLKNLKDHFKNAEELSILNSGSLTTDQKLIAFFDGVNAK